MARAKGKHFFGFGLGPLQAGLFLLEAWRSRKFARLTVCEIDARLVDALKDGRLTVNVAGENGLAPVVIDGIEVLHPVRDAATIVKRITESDELATSLPHVLSYQNGDPSPADLLARGLDGSRPRAIYTAENHPHAAEILKADVLKRRLLPSDTVFLGTVIGRMAATVRDAAAIAERKLTPIVPGYPAAVVAESFDRILVAKNPMRNFESGFPAFTPKADLAPYAEVHLYGHIAAHAVLAWEAHRRGLSTMDEVRERPEMLFLGERLFDECARTLLSRHKGVWDPIFTEAGFRNEGRAVLRRITSPYLRDPVLRIIRDPARKLMPRDRLVGPVALAMEGGMKPSLFPVGAGMALEELVRHPDQAPAAARKSLAGRRMSRDRFESILDILWEMEGTAAPDLALRELLWEGFRSAMG
jgi:mannitol-1-phosphate 5-dehydrogenase